MEDFSQELVKEFLTEAFDLLDSLERSLLELEKNSGDEKAIQEIFRAAHTIKGGAGTVGFQEIQQLTHLLEDVLDLARKKKIKFSTEDISLLLSCRDALEKMLTTREGGSVYSGAQIPGIVDRLNLIKQGVRQDQPAAAAAAAVKPEPSPAGNTSSLDKLGLSNYELSLINEFLGQKHKVFVLTYTLNQTYEMRDVSAFQVYALLNDISEIVKIQPSIEELEKAFYTEIHFIISTEKPESYVRDKTMLKDLVDSLEIREIDQDFLGKLENAASNESSIPASPDAVSRTQAPEQDAAVPAIQESAAAAKPLDAAADKDGVSEPFQKRNVATLRVESWKVDELLNLLGELVITKATFSQLNTDFDRVGADIKVSLKEFLSGISRLNLSGEADQVKEKNALLLQSLQDLFTSFDMYSESIQKLNRISSSLQENVMNMRMVPIQMVFSRFPRLIRDIAEKLGKDIDLLVEGVETEIDKGMVDDIFDPLIHILRNAVDHGIESPASRQASGKPVKGKIILKAVHEGDSIVIEVTDDGKGIDVETIKRKAVESGFMSVEAVNQLSQKEALGLIFLPGLSTAKQVSDLSGRGVGMDVVKKKIEEIGGNVGVATAKGKGTKIVIRLPLTLAIIQGLLIVVGGMHYVIPVASVEETVIVKMEDMKEINGKLTLELRGKFIPVLSLKKYFYNEEIDTSAGQKEYCIVSRMGESLVGILVSEVIGEQDIVIKSLNTKLIKSPGISAATIVGNGDIGYIVDTAQIIGQYFRK